MANYTVINLSKQGKYGIIGVLDREMAPAVRQHPEAWTTRGVLVIKGSVAYVLCRVEDDASLTLISEHEDICAGVAAGKHQVEVEDFDFSYGLYADGVKVASFAEGRIGYREWALRSGRLDYIHSIDDRYDHDIDELMT
jgi:hypothetical protein